MERPPPSGSEGNPSISVESEVPLIAEKPFITYVEDGGKFNLVVPGVESGTSGVAKPMKNATVVPFESFHVTDPSDTAAVINAKLVEGLHIVVTPGVYELEDSLEIKQENQVVRLAAEHTTEDNVVWNGDRGTTFFYQAEIMYDCMEDEWLHSCYRIGEGVKDHKATGLGCFSYFRDHAGSCAHGVDTGGGSFNIDKAASMWLNGFYCSD
ncbi:hypothetical protein TrST_g3650 [Triparma strigata]|uniref:Uncharacterized protein n=1 Tax=Triparma strigata TaxID=1606541 RepID=A0A9W7ERF5_9STRA|nr:hypothetical protein TrST_g3650 [Triparma strigata]